MGNHTETYGESYAFGVNDADAPAIAAGFSCRKVELKYAPEVKTDATNGEGHAESTSISKKEKRMITGSFTGYISKTFSPNSIPNSFSFTVNSVPRTFILDDISEPRSKGEYVEVTVAATSKFLVTGEAS